MKLVVWVTPDQHEALLAGESVATADPEPARLAAFCARHRIPWRTPNTRIACVADDVPPEVAARHRGLVRLCLDAEWLLEEIKLVVPGRLADLLLALDDREARGHSVWRELREVRILGGAPADRGDAIAGLVAGYRGSYQVEARLLRAIDIDDVDSWVPETGLPLVIGGA